MTATVVSPQLWASTMPEAPQHQDGRSVASERCGMWLDTVWCHCDNPGWRGIGFLLHMLGGNAASNDNRCNSVRSLLFTDNDTASKNHTLKSPPRLRKAS